MWCSASPLLNAFYSLPRNFFRLDYVPSLLLSFAVNIANVCLCCYSPTWLLTHKLHIHTPGLANPPSVTEDRKKERYTPRVARCSSKANLAAMSVIFGIYYLWNYIIEEKWQCFLAFTKGSQEICGKKNAKYGTTLATPILRRAVILNVTSRLPIQFQ